MKHLTAFLLALLIAAFSRAQDPNKQIVVKGQIDTLAELNSIVTDATLLDSVDEDDMASDSATLVPTQQSVKAYADTKQDALTDADSLDTAIGGETIGTGDFVRATGPSMTDAILGGTTRLQRVSRATTATQTIANAETLTLSLTDSYLRADFTGAGATLALPGTDPTVDTSWLIVGKITTDGVFSLTIPDGLYRISRDIDTVTSTQIETFPATANGRFRLVVDYDVSFDEYSYEILGDDFASTVEEVWVVALGDETSALTTGTAKRTIRAPFAASVSEVRASLVTVSSSGAPAFDINEGGVSILSTTLTIDANEKISTTAATPAVVSDTAIADFAELTFDIDTAGTSAAGAIIYIYVTRQ